MKGIYFYFILDDIIHSILFIVKMLLPQASWKYLCRTKCRTPSFPSKKNGIILSSNHDVFYIFLVLFICKKKRPKPNILEKKREEEREEWIKNQAVLETDNNDRKKSLSRN